MNYDIQIKNLGGFVFDSNEICDRHEKACKDYEKLKNSNNEEVSQLEQLSRIVKDIPLYENIPELVRWGDVQSAIYDTDTLSASIVPSFGNIIPNMILSQAPTYEIVYDFLAKQLTRNIKTFVVLETKADRHANNIIRREKYYKYWSSKVGNVKNFQNISVTTLEIERKENINIIDVLIVNTDTVEMINVRIIHYLAWVDMNSICVNELDRLVNVVKDVSVFQNNILIHCSGGIGRAGTLCTALLLHSISNDKIAKINIDELILFVKICRPFAIQTDSQYELLADYTNSLVDKLG